MDTPENGDLLFRPVSESIPYLFFVAQCEKFREAVIFYVSDLLNIGLSRSKRDEPPSVLLRLRQYEVEALKHFRDERPHEAVSPEGAVAHAGVEEDRPGSGLFRFMEHGWPQFRLHHDEEVGGGGASESSHEKRKIERYEPDVVDEILELFHCNLVSRLGDGRQYHPDVLSRSQFFKEIGKRQGLAHARGVDPYPFFGAGDIT